MAFVTIGSATDRGLKKKDNQDFHAFFSPEEGRTNNKGLLLVLADGMGGRQGGALASKMTVEIIMEEYYKDMSSNISQSLNRAFLKANEAVLAKGQTDEDLEGMASTLVTAALKNDKIYFANVGDSRGYLIDQNGISRFTEDHSYVASLVKAGVISEEEAQTHPESNVITRAIGLDADLQAFVPETPQKLKEGQYVLLCCDGLSGVVSDEEMLAAVNEYREPDVVCKELVKKANGYGGPDNITVIVARIDKIESISSIVNKFMNLVRK